MTNTKNFTLLLCLIYLISQLILIPQTIITADEFVFMRHLLDYTRYIPYQDFLPYKSVLGHYLLAIPLFFSQSLLTPIFLIKSEIALINTAGIALAIYWATKFFDKKAVLLAMTAVLANQFSFFYLADLRVDMLSAWFCLFSALSILQHNIRRAGILIGIGFLISQKALWYIVAINGGMLICWWALSAYRLRGLLIFNSYAAVIVAIYLATWSCITSPSVVLYNFFYDAYIQAGIQYYMQIYAPLWQAMLSHGPILFLLWPLTFISLFDKKAQDVSHLFTVSSAAITLILFISYKQPFPYNFVFTLPAFFLVYSAFFTWLTQNKNLPSYSLSLTIVYALTIFSFILILALPTLNVLIALLPLSIYIASHSPRYRTHAINFFYSIFILIGIVMPFYFTEKSITKFNGYYQQAMIQTTAALTKDGSDYIAGVPLLYNKEQAINGIKNLISPQIEYLSTQNEKLKPLLLPSIYLSDTTADAVIDDLKRSNVKVFITNYRTLALAPAIILYIGNHYQHYYGSIYLYAPKVFANQLSFVIKFAATYRIEAPAHAVIKIDNKRKHSGEIIKLKKGDHLSYANKNYRLILVPDEPLKLDPQYAQDEWLRTL